MADFVDACHGGRYEALSAKLSPAELEAAKIQRVHPSFRVLALATPPTTQNPWLTAEILGLFAFHGVPTALPEVRQSIAHLSCRVTTCSPPFMERS